MPCRLAAETRARRRVVVFHATVTRKRVLTSDRARIAIAALRRLEVVPVDETLVEAALDLHDRFQLRYWDALIVAAARLSGCVRVLSEDLNAGQDYDGVAVINPFAAAAP